MGTEAVNRRRCCPAGGWDRRPGANRALGAGGGRRDGPNPSRRRLNAGQLLPLQAPWRAAHRPGPFTPPRPLPLRPPLVQLLQHVLGYCSPRELGTLEATCSYFIKTGLTDRIAKHFLKEIPRAKGLKPDIR